MSWLDVLFIAAPAMLVVAMAAYATGEMRGVDRKAREIREVGNELAALRAERDALQARLDALMLEHCPDEMTPEQVAEWARHQVLAKERRHA